MLRPVILLPENLESAKGQFSFCGILKDLRRISKTGKQGVSKQYYDKVKWRETMKEHRQYKEELKQQGLIA